MSNSWSVRAILILCALHLGCSDDTRTEPEPNPPCEDKESPRAEPLLLNAPQPKQSEEFGFSLAASGNTLLVGARGSNIAGPHLSGAAYVFERDVVGTWGHTGSLTASDARSGDRFGHAVATTEKVAAVGTLFGKSGAVTTGAVYLFEKQENGQWQQASKLTPPDEEGMALFGSAVALEGEWLVVGAFQGGQRDEGAAYVYRRRENGWNLEARLSAGDARPNAHFGISVAISRETIVIGAYADDTRGEAAGAVYVFSRVEEQWREQAKLVASDGAEGDFFGLPVDIHEDVLVVGAYLNENQAGEDAGTVYVFRRVDSTWTEEARLVPSDAAPGDGFGSSVSVMNDLIVAGAYQHDGTGQNSGSIYAFRRGEEAWHEVADLRHDGVAPNDEMGSTIDLSTSGFIVSGAPQAGASVSGAGTVYLSMFEKTCPQTASTTSKAPLFHGSKAAE